MSAMDNEHDDGTPKMEVLIHDAEEVGYWAEVPALPGCVTEGDTFEALLGESPRCS